MENTIIDKATEFVKKIFENDYSGHDSVAVSKLMARLTVVSAVCGSILTAHHYVDGHSITEHSVSVYRHHFKIPIVVCSSITPASSMLNW